MTLAAFHEPERLCEFAAAFTDEDLAIWLTKAALPIASLGDGPYRSKSSPSGARPESLPHRGISLASTAGFRAASGHPYRFSTMKEWPPISGVPLRPDAFRESALSTVRAVQQ
jgi:hypothetical protein